MCGISGAYRAERLKCDLSHRGPDRYTGWADGVLHVDHHRLQMTGGDVVPFENEHWAVWLNGEIYNHRELGHRSVSGCDTEAVLREFTAKGRVDVSRFNGQFAIVAYNKKEQECYLVRDRWGVKPMYYDTRGRFASELSAWADEGYRPDFEAWEQYLAFQNILTNQTYLQGVRLLKPGHMIRLSNLRITKWHEWPKERTQQADPHVLMHHIRAAMAEQGRIGAFTFLSGGVDSGLIAHRMACPAITAKFDGPLDESELAKGCARSTHYIIDLPITERAKYLPETWRVVRDPRVGPCWSNIALYNHLHELGIRCVYEGCGADEFNAGYTWRYKEPDYWHVVNRTGRDSEYLREVFKAHFPVDSLEARIRFDIDHFLPAVLLVTDQCSAAYGIETRVPFLDNDLCDYLMTCTTQSLMGKKAMKEAALLLGLPKVVTERPKRGFTSGDGLGKTRHVAAKGWSEMVFAHICA